MKIFKIVLMICLFFGGISSAKQVIVLQFSGVINPMASEYIVRGISTAEKEKAECVIIQMDTPGGLDTSMRSIVQKILDSEIPVVVHVYPKGARSASAGLFIAMASDYIVMSSETNLGAAHPVDISGKTASEKITNDAAAYIRTLAKNKGRDEKWAEKAVRESVSITEAEALDKKIIDAIADDIHSLIVKLDGQKIKRLKGEVILNLKDAEIKYVKMSKREGLFHVLGDPNVAYVLFMIGLYGLIYELAAPGIGLAGIAGTICILLALVSFGSLPINYAGVALIILAVVLFILEIKAMTHGVLATGGAVSLFIGSLLMFNPMVPYFRISLTVVITMLVLTVGFFAFIISIGIASLKGKVVTGISSLIHSIGEVKVGIDPEGIVFVNNEDWSAVSNTGEPIKKGEEVKVISVEGVKLVVEPLKKRKE
ncbi:MAG: nodulation protein NfeD [Candidatus Firestonebacteria bacterium]